jgi:hypothetical protein
MKNPQSQPRFKTTLSLLYSTYQRYQLCEDWSVGTGNPVFWGDKVNQRTFKFFSVEKNITKTWNFEKFEHTYCFQEKNIKLWKFEFSLNKTFKYNWQCFLRHDLINQRLAQNTTSSILFFWPYSDRTWTFLIISYTVIEPRIVSTKVRALKFCRKFCFVLFQNFEFMVVFLWPNRHSNQICSLIGPYWVILFFYLPHMEYARRCRSLKFVPRLQPPHFGPIWILKFGILGIPLIPIPTKQG